MLTTQKYIVYLKAHNKKDYIEGTKGIKFKDGLNKSANYMNILLKIIRKLCRIQHLKEIQKYFYL